MGSDNVVQRQFERLMAIEDVLANGAQRGDDPECHPLYPSAVSARQVLQEEIAALQQALAETHNERAALEEQVEAMREFQPYHGQNNPAGAQAAIRASCDMLAARYERARCDDESVACCIRCNTMFLVNKARALINKEPKE